MPERAKITVARFANGVAVQVAGAGTMAESPMVNAFAEEVMRDRSQRVIVDLAACTYLDSTFLGGLVSLLKRHGRPDAPTVTAGPRFSIYAPQPQRRALFSVSRLDTILPFVEELPSISDEALPLEPQVATSRDELANYIIECHRRLAELGGNEAQDFARVADALAGEIDTNRRS